MKDEVNDRILKLINSKKMTSQKFASLLNVQSSNISHITSKRNKPSFDLLYNILSAFPEVSSDWLLMGIGDMYRDAGNEMKEEEVLETIPVKPVLNIVEGNLFEEESVNETNSMPVAPTSFTNKTQNSLDQQHDTPPLEDALGPYHELYSDPGYSFREIDALFNDHLPFVPISSEDALELKKEDYEQLNDRFQADNEVKNENIEEKVTVPIEKLASKEVQQSPPSFTVSEHGINVSEKEDVANTTMKEVIVENSTQEKSVLTMQNREVVESEPQQPSVIAVGKSKKVDKILLLFDDNTYQEFFGKENKE